MKLMSMELMPPMGHHPSTLLLQDMDFQLGFNLKDPTKLSSCGEDIL